MSIERVNLIGVPIDVCSPQELETEILELLARPGTKHIVLLTVWDLLKAKRNAEFKDCIRNASLILPISKSLIKGAKFLRLSPLTRYNPFDAVIQILSILENHNKTMYMFGSNKKILQRAEMNVTSTFPNLRLVGRCIGYYSKTMEDSIVQAIFKAQPSLVLISDGIKDKKLWAWKRRNRFSNSIFLYYKEAFGIFSKKIKRINPKIFARGQEILIEIFKNPFKIFLIFPFIHYLCLLFIYKFVKR